MKIYPPPEGLDNDDIKSGRWTIYADVKCSVCGKEHALANCISSANGPRCIKCGGLCT